MNLFGLDRDARDVYRRLLGYAARYWNVFLLALLGMALYGATVTGIAMLVKPLLDGTFIARDPQVIKTLPVFVLLLFIARGVASFVSSYGMEWIGRQVIRALRQEVFEKYLDLPAAYFDQSSAGVLLSKLTYNVEQVAESSTRAITILVRDTLTFIGLIAWMLYLDAKLSMFIFIIGPLVAALISYVSKRFRRYSTRIQDSMGDVTRVAEEAIAGQRVIKIFGGQGHESEHFGRVNEDNRKLFMKLAMVKSGSIPIVQLIAALGIAAIIFFATSESYVGAMTAGDFASFMSAMLFLMDPLKRLTDINVVVQRGIAAAHSIFAVLDAAPEPPGGSFEVERAGGEIRFEGVEFGYGTERPIVLRRIDLTIAAGETVAFVGRSGSGKSTLVSLLPRFYAPQGGVIALDGVPIDEYSLANLRAQIALVSQDVTLFNDSIANNIAFGGLRDASRERIVKAARAGHVLEFAERLPDGLDTLVGDRGVLLSGGQRQRIAIARALLKDAPILILDEATSSLDTESERQIQAALDELMRDRTTLVIAHRLSTVESADQIVVLDEGNIVEQGTHKSLLERGGIYASLYRMQFSES